MTKEQADFAYNIGLERYKRNRRRNAEHKYDWKPNPKQIHFDGMSSMAQQLVALTTNRNWRYDSLVPDKPGEGNVDGSGIMARWTEKHNWSLIVHPEDPDELKCVLVTGPSHPLTIKGWIYAHEAKYPQYWRDDVRHSAYFYNGPIWHPIADLIIPIPDQNAQLNLQLTV